MKDQVGSACSMSPCGPSPHFAAAQQFGRFRREADTNTKDLTLAPNKPCCKHRNIASAFGYEFDFNW
jgi:hypothetical protein